MSTDKSSTSKKKDHGDKTFDEYPFSLIPAGCRPDSSVTLYVTLERTKKASQAVSWERKDSVVTINCPDRTLRAATRAARRPMTESYDFALHAHHYVDQSIHMRQGVHRRTRVSAANGGVIDEQVPKRVKLLIDSGGSQLLHDSTDFLPPWGVIDWMNRTGGEAMALDVPPRPGDYVLGQKHLDELAQIQADNNIIFAKEVDRERVRLLNVCHGVTAAQQRRWMDIVSSEACTGWGVGDVLGRPPLLIARLLCSPAFESRPRASDGKRVHALGVGSPGSTPMLAWLGKRMGNDSALTADATSWLLGSRTSKYLRPKDWQWEVLSPGRDYERPTGRMLPCSCPICSAIVWEDAISLPFGQTSWLRSHHNWYALRQCEQIWNQRAAQSETAEEFLFDTPFRVQQSAADAIRYIETVFNEKSIDAADAKFVKQLSRLDSAPARRSEPIPFFGEGVGKAMRGFSGNSKHVISGYRRSRISEVAHGTAPSPSPGSFSLGFIQK